MGDLSEKINEFLNNKILEINNSKKFIENYLNEIIFNKDNNLNG